MKVLTVSLILCFLAAIVNAQKANADGRYRDPPLYGDMQTLFERHYELVRSAILDKSMDSWEGAYVYGTHHPDSLLISENAGFMAIASDHGGGTRFNYGSVRKEGRRIFLTPKIVKGNLNYEPVEESYRIVDFSGMTYLLPEDELEQFAWIIHSKTEFSLVDYPSKGTPNEADTNLPDLPEKYLKIIREKPLTVQVTRITKDIQNTRDIWGIYAMELEISKGSQGGVVKGMHFFLYLDTKIVVFRVTNVDKNRATVDVVYTAEDFPVYIEKPELRQGMSLRAQLPSVLNTKILEVHNEEKAKNWQVTNITINKGSQDGVSQEMDSFSYRNKQCVKLSDMLISPKTTIATVSVLAGKCIKDGPPKIKVGTILTTRPKGGNFALYDE